MTRLVPVLFIFCVAGLIHTASMQDVEFVESPLSYYYLIPETIVLIPCWVRQQQEDTDSQQTLSATFYRNSTPINVEDPPFNHFLSVDSFENVIGLGIIYSSAYHSTTYQCEAGGLWSGTVAVFVGDGYPLQPVSEPFQIAETLYSVTLAWDYSPTPVHLPLLGYNITLRSCDHSHDKEVAIVTSGNETELILFDLSPGTSYCVTASGWNLMGHGPASSVVRVTTMSAVVPPAPTHLRQRHRQRGQLSVMWQAVQIEYDIMTPLQDYLVIYGAVGSTQNITATDDNSTTEFSFYVGDSSDVLVGVASRNSVGYSAFTYVTLSAIDQDDNASLSLSEFFVLLGTIVAALLLCIILVVCMIAVLCCRNNCSHSTTNKNTLSSSSSTSSKTSTPPKCHTPNLQIDYDPTEGPYTALASQLQEYLSEPRKMGLSHQKPLPPPYETLGVGHTTFR